MSFLGGSQESIPRGSEWYRSFLRNKIERLDISFIEIISPRPGATPEEARFNQVIGIASEVASLISTEENVTIQQIVDNLHTRGSLIHAEPLKPLAWQLIFIVIGLVTLLYSPVLAPPPNTFQINIGDRSNVPRVRSKGKVWKQSRIDANEASGYSLGDMLRRFSGKGPVPLGINFERLIEQDVLRSANLSYYTLHKLAKIEILWVDSICQHLEFDSGTRTLRMLRFPSFCVMMCLGDVGNGTTHLCRYGPSFCYSLLLVFLLTFLIYIVF